MPPPGNLSHPPPASHESSSSYPSQFRVIIPMPLISGMSGGVPCPKCQFSPSGHSGNTFSMKQDSYGVSTNGNVCVELIGRIFQICGCT